MADKEVTFRWNDGAIKSALRNAAFDGLLAAGDVLRQSMADTVGQPGTPTPGQPPKRQTGDLMESMKTEPNRLDGSVLVGTNDKRGRWLEFGVTVRATKARSLTIPLNDRAKLISTRAQASGGLRNSGKKFVKIKSDAGNWLLVEATPKGKIRKNGAMFILRKVVRISPRPWLWVSYNKARGAMNVAFRERARASYRSTLGIK